MLKLNDNIIINLDNVNSVVEIENKNRIVFNFNYPVTVIKGDEKLQRSDYVYYDDYRKFTTLEALHETFANAGFVNFGNKWINLKNVAFIKFDANRNRIIINFNSSISFKNKNNEMQLTSDFIYIDSKNISDYEENLQLIENYLGV